MESNLQALKESHYHRYFNYTSVLLVIIIISSILNITHNRLYELSDGIKISYGGLLLCCCIFHVVYRKRKLTKIALCCYVFTIGLSGVVVGVVTAGSVRALNPFIIALLMSTIYFEYNPLHYLYIQIINLSIFIIVQVLLFSFKQIFILT